jgi:hypothetical protein
MRDVTTVSDDIVLPRGSDVQAPVIVVFDMGTPTSAAYGLSVGCGSAMQRSSRSRLMDRTVLVSAFSATDAVVAPAPMAELVTSAVETAGDYSTGASFPLLSNASWPEAFLALSEVAGGALRTNNNLNQSEVEEKSMCKTRMGVGIVTYLDADLIPNLQGLGGAFLALFCDPASPNELGPDLGHSSVMEVLEGVSVTRSSADTTLWGIFVDGSATASSDLASSSSSSMLIVSMLKLTIVVSADTAGLVLFCFFFLASVV